MIRRPLIHRLPEDSGLPRPQTCVPQFRSDRELGRSHWRPGSPIITRFHALLGLSMSGHTRDTMAASLFMFAGVSMTMRLGAAFLWLRLFVWPRAFMDYRGPFYGRWTFNGREPFYGPGCFYGPGSFYGFLWPWVFLWRRAFLEPGVPNNYSSLSMATALPK
jgi:hypothetical protein